MPAYFVRKQFPHKPPAVLKRYVIILHMKTKKIIDLSVEEFPIFISDTVNTAMQDSIEDFIALSSDNYLKSIKEAREEYKKGKVKTYEEVFNV